MSEDPTAAGPAVVGVHHFSATVSNVEASVEWYLRVFGMSRVPVQFPHHRDEDGGYAVVLMEPRSGISIGLHHHEANPGDGFDERRNGLDHIAFNVAERADLDVWAAWLDTQDVAHTGVSDVTVPVPYSTLVFRDPDNIQLELFYMAS